MNGEGIAELNGDLVAGSGHGRESLLHGGLVDKLQSLNGAEHCDKYCVMIEQE